MTYNRFAVLIQLELKSFSAQCRDPCIRHFESLLGHFLDSFQRDLRSHSLLLGTRKLLMLLSCMLLGTRNLAMLLSCQLLSSMLISKRLHLAARCVEHGGNGSNTREQTPHTTAKHNNESKLDSEPKRLYELIHEDCFMCKHVIAARFVRALPVCMITYTFCIFLHAVVSDTCPRES
jgi:hypothetical protein